MRLTIFGATGGTGLPLVWKALDHGHIVTALVRSPEKLAGQHENLTLVQGDVKDPKVVAKVIAGADGVISALGPRPGSPDDLMEIAARNITEAMEANGVKRLIWATGAGVGAPQDQPTFMHKSIQFLLKLLSGKVLEGSLRGAQIIQNSHLDWTIARGPMLTNESGSGAYNVGYVNADMGRTLSRENFATWMLDLVETDEWIHELPAASDRN